MQNKQTAGIQSEVGGSSMLCCVGLRGNDDHSTGPLLAIVHFSVPRTKVVIPTHNCGSPISGLNSGGQIGINPLKNRPWIILPQIIYLQMTQQT